MSFKKVQITEMEIKDLISLIKEAVASEMQNLNHLKDLQETSAEEHLLTRKEAKNLLKTSYTSLWKYDRDGLLPAKRIAGRVYYLRSDLFNILNKVA